MDRAVLARRVDPLQDDQDRMLGLGPQPVLEPGQPGQAVGQLLLGVRLRVAVRLGRVDPVELDLRPGLDPEEVAQALFGHGHFLGLRAGIVHGPG